MLSQFSVHSCVPVPKSYSVIMCVYATQRKGTGDDNPHTGLMFEHGVGERERHNKELSEKEFVLAAE
jgi:hypothetical protein